MAKTKYNNPFRPGAGHKPPHLAGREEEISQFQELLTQEFILRNMVLTGLRGVGKTVLLDHLKPLAMEAGWIWIGNDLSESASLSELHVCTRMMADLSAVTSAIKIEPSEVKRIGFGGPAVQEQTLDFGAMQRMFTSTPGLCSDKLKAVLEKSWEALKPHKVRGVVFAYDEAQNMKDHAAKEEFPLSLMLDVFQSIQKKGIPFMLLLAGLPTLFPKLVEARTFAERMFRVVFLDRLNHDQSKDAIVKPVEKLPVKMNAESVEVVIFESGGYPYFIQFMCREVYDIFLQRVHDDLPQNAVPIGMLKSKLDCDFFAGRWAKTSDRQRELLTVISQLPDCDVEFTISDAAKLSQQTLAKPFSASQISNMFQVLSEAGLVFKNRHGRYSFAVPMLGDFIKRQSG